MALRSPVVAGFAHGRGVEVRRGCRRRLLALGCVVGASR